MESAQESSIFWNSLMAGVSVVVTLADAGEDSGGVA
jgi:hypothetical protein